MMIKTFSQFYEGVTFKTVKPTGRFKSFDSDSNLIKLDKMEIGSIDSDAPFKIRLTVEKEDIMEDGNPNCTWKWIRLKKDFTSLEEAKAWFVTNFDAIAAKYKFHKM